jgi:hypothetical protein
LYIGPRVYPKALHINSSIPHIMSLSDEKTSSKGEHEHQDFEFNRHDVAGVEYAGILGIFKSPKM